MINSCKSNLIAWWIAITLVVILWYRNILYDRWIASFLLIIAFIQLIHYGCHSMMDSEVAGKLILLNISILLLIIPFATYMYTQEYLALALTAASLLLVIVMQFKDGTAQAYVDEIDTFPKWEKGGESMLAGLVAPLLIIVFLSWLIMVSYFDYQNVGLYVIALYVSLTLIYSYLNHEHSQAGSCSLYILSGLALVSWLVGIFS